MKIQATRATMRKKLAQPRIPPSSFMSQFYDPRFLVKTQYFLRLGHLFNSLLYYRKHFRRHGNKYFFGNISTLPLRGRADFRRGTKTPTFTTPSVNFFSRPCNFCTKKCHHKHHLLFSSMHKRSRTRIRANYPAPPVFFPRRKCPKRDHDHKRNVFSSTLLLFFFFKKSLAWSVDPLY